MSDKHWIKWCPHAKTAETPCYLRHGAEKLNSGHCAGCERSQELLDIEKRKLRRGDVCK